MKVYLQNEKYFMDDNGKVVELTPTKNNSLKLPENSCQRQWCEISKLLKAPNHTIDYGNEVKQPRTLGPRITEKTKTMTSTKSLEDYLSEDDKKLYLELVAKAQKAMAIEKKQAEIKALQAEIETLQNDGDNN